MERVVGAKFILFITDGYSRLNVDSIVARAGQLNVRVVCVAIGVPLSADLQRIADETGGFGFGGVQSAQRAEEIAHEIYWRFSGIFPVEYLEIARFLR